MPILGDIAGDGVLIPAVGVRDDNEVTLVAIFYESSSRSSIAHEGQADAA